MTTDPAHDLDERFERAFADEPPPRPDAIRVAAGRRALRRRRVSAGLGAGALSVAVLGAAVAVVPHEPAAPASQSSVATGPTRSPAGQDDPADPPVKPSPYVKQGVEAVALWTDDDGTLFRHDATVDLLSVEPVADIIGVDTGRPVGEVTRYIARWRGETAAYDFGTAQGRPVSGQLGGTALAKVDPYDEPLYYWTDGRSHEVFTDLTGITPDGRISPRFGAVVVQQGPAAVWDESRFAARPSAGIVDFLGTRYYALVGYQPDEHDVGVAELAPAGRSLDQWVADVRDRMRSGEELG